MYKIIGADGKEYGPIPADTLRQWIAEGRANGQTRVLAEGAAQWKPLAEFPEFGLAPTPRTIPAPRPMASSALDYPKDHPLALTGLILGLVSVTFGLCCCYGLPFNVAGIICSSRALYLIHRNPELYRGKGTAIAGIALCILSILLAMAFIAFGIALRGTDIRRHFDHLESPI